MRKAGFAMLLVSVALLAAPAGAATKTELPLVVRNYVKAGALGTPAGGERMQQLAAPGSNAWANAVARTATYQSAQDAGQPFSPATVTFSKNAARVCSGTPRVCNALKSFSVKKNKVADFTRDGQSLDGTLSTGDGSQHDALGSKLSVVGAYTASTSGFVVAVKVENGPAQLSFSYIGHYIEADGHQVQSAAQLYPGADLRPNTTATISFVFPDAAPGGTVIVKCSDETASEAVETSLPVPVFSAT